MDSSAKLRFELEQTQTPDKTTKFTEKKKKKTRISRSNSAESGSATISTETSQGEKSEKKEKKKSFVSLAKQGTSSLPFIKSRSGSTSSERKSLATLSDSQSEQDAERSHSSSKEKSKKKKKEKEKNKGKNLQPDSDVDYSTDTLSNESEARESSKERKKRFSSKKDLKKTNNELEVSYASDANLSETNSKNSTSSQSKTKKATERHSAAELNKINILNEKDKKFVPEGEEKDSGESSPEDEVVKSLHNEITTLTSITPVTINSSTTTSSTSVTVSSTTPTSSTPVTISTTPIPINPVNPVNVNIVGSNAVKDSDIPLVSSTVTSSTTSSILMVMRDTQSVSGRKIIAKPSFSRVNSKSDLIQKVLERRPIEDHILTRSDIEAVIHQANLQKRIYFSELKAVAAAFDKIAQDNAQVITNNEAIMLHLVLNDTKNDNWVLIQITLGSEAAMIKHADSAHNTDLPGDLHRRLVNAFRRGNNFPQFEEDYSIFVKDAPSCEHPVRAFTYAIQNQDLDHPLKDCNINHAGQLQKTVQRCIMESYQLESDDAELRKINNLDIFEPENVDKTTYKFKDHFINKTLNLLTDADESPFEKIIHQCIENLKKVVDQYENSFWYWGYRWWYRGEYETHLEESKELIKALSQCRNCKDYENLLIQTNQDRKSTADLLSSLTDKLKAKKLLSGITEVLKTIDKKMTNINHKGKYHSKFESSAAFLKRYTERLKQINPGSAITANKKSWIGKEYSIQEYRDKKNEKMQSTLAMNVENHDMRDEVLGSFYQIFDNQEKNDGTKLRELEKTVCQYQKKLEGTPLGEQLYKIRAYPDEQENLIYRPDKPGCWGKYNKVWNKSSAVISNIPVSDVDLTLDLLKDFMVPPRGIFSGRSHLDPVKKVLAKYEREKPDNVQQILDEIATELDLQKPVHLPQWQKVKPDCELMKRIRFIEYQTDTLFRLVLPSNHAVHESKAYVI